MLANWSCGGSREVTQGLASAPTTDCSHGNGEGAGPLWNSRTKGKMMDSFQKDVTFLTSEPNVGSELKNRKQHHGIKHQTDSEE